MKKVVRRKRSPNVVSIKETIEKKMIVVFVASPDMWILERKEKKGAPNFYVEWGFSYLPPSGETVDRGRAFPTDKAEWAVESAVDWAYERMFGGYEVLAFNTFEEFLEYRSNFYRGVLDAAIA